VTDSRLPASAGDAARLFELRSAPVRDFAEQAAAVAGACHAMAVRFQQGGKLDVARCGRQGHPDVDRGGFP
jgi:D-sedoheptulose 7-phosphate isomerase